MKTEMIFCILLTVISIVLCAGGFILLPDEVVLQIRLDGKPGTMAPKLVALAIPAVLTLVGLIGFLLGGETRFVSITAISVLVEIITILINR